ncbi:5-(carboxyamino)imidazole ribonucleotide synthase [Halonotius terrestris]|uniref:N5-carboxyaminoimidazole ribonucleotide synthase n=1 Tax=Halonotius terrestris TaxID=2487750 RepID=A0A8J8TBF4_9EURY|nr:5-(carboxyamino)imidazole ribonucleotide synthase [Halonotius terrestris]TQQ80872.1 5-(carboxyamino)imidazole ribonucleotide synthase [Halonotius terrestris]
MRGPVLPVSYHRLRRRPYRIVSAVLHKIPARLSRRDSPRPQVGTLIFRRRNPSRMTTLPGPTLGVVGGGQLGRMLAEAAAPLGVEVIVLDPTPQCPASLVARDQIVGEFDDPDAVRELAAASDVLTFEIELADPDLLEDVADEYDIPINPDPGTLRTIQDKLVQKEALADAGIPVPDFIGIGGEKDLRLAVEELDGVMLKAREGGYDGRGNTPVQDPDDAADALNELGVDTMAEAFVPFERELSVIGVKGADGVDTYPVTETIHEEEILRASVSPARTDDDVRDRAREVARDVLEFLDGYGVYGIELFETEDGDILVNEIAPRPHNSGHWTIEGARTSQFETHVRAVLGWPLGPTALREPTVSVNILGDVSEPEAATLHNVDRVLDSPNAHMHWYGKKQVRPLRKMGHITVTDPDAADGEGADDASDRDALLDRAESIRDSVTFVGE